MRNIEYISPSAFNLYSKDSKEYYRRYLCDNRPERDPQTQPMAIGSAFDAYVKSYIHNALFGDKDARFDLRTIFEAQVDRHLWDWAWQHGSYVFDQYQQSGCLADLMLLLKNTASEPRFEFEIRGTVSGYREGMEGQFGQVVLLGKPDVDFVTSEGVHVILDFKVNGYCSNYPVTPKQGYVKCRAAGGTNFGEHKKCKWRPHHGMRVNYAHYLEEIDKDWATQLAIYGWLCGEPIGSEFITVVHQLCCDNTKTKDATGRMISLPSIKIAEHVTRISADYQRLVFNRLVDLWEIVHSDHFFREMTKQQNDDLCELLNQSIDPDLAWMR